MHLHLFLLHIIAHTLAGMHIAYPNNLNSFFPSYSSLEKKKMNNVGARTFPARSFPPDGTTFSQITLGQKLSKQIPPYSYWNMQFYQSEPAYVKFDYNIPRGASIGVYARRNALPTHTQYHFKEVLSGFNARTTRSTHVSAQVYKMLHCFFLHFLCFNLK